jgi:hypothetical protein
MPKRKTEDVIPVARKKIVRKPADPVLKKVYRKFHPDMFLASRPPMPDLEPVDDDVVMGTGLKKRRRRCKSCGSLPKRGGGGEYHAPAFSAVQPPGGSKWVYDRDSQGRIIGRHAEYRDPSLNLSRDNPAWKHMPLPDLVPRNGGRVKSS